MGFSRHRERGDEHTDVWTQTYYPIGGTGVNISGTLPRLWTFYESIDDFVGDREGVHPTTHILYKFTYQSGLGTRWYASDGTLAVMTSDKGDVIDGLRVAEILPDISGNAIHQAAVNNAFNALCQQIPEEISIGNFLLEANEIKDLIPKLEGNLVRDVSSGFLNFNFGWKPFVGDLRTLYGLISSVERRLQYLRDTYGRWTRQSYYQDLALPSNVPSETLDAQPYSHRYVRTDYRCIFRAGGYLYHELQGLNDDLGKVRAFIAALGLTNPSKIYWNNLPYSFVVDWFLDIGGLLDRLAIQPFAGTWQFVKVTNSISQFGKFVVYREFFSNDPRNQRFLVGEGSVKRYHRFVGLPVDPGFWLSPNLPSTQQQLLGAALLGVRL